MIALPITKVGNLNYALEFRVNAGSDPVTMDLLSAREIIPNNLWNKSEFDPATGVLTVPTLDVDGADYSGEFGLISQAPIRFQLRGANYLPVLQIIDTDGDGIPDSRDAFPTVADATWLTDAQRNEINLVIDRFAKNQIDPVTGCGFRAGWGFPLGAGEPTTRYPDGVMRRNPSEGDSWFVKARRSAGTADPSEFIPETSVQYWADWFGYSPDIEQVKKQYWENSVSPNIERRIAYYETALEIEDDAEFCEVACGPNDSAADSRLNLQSELIKMQNQLNTTEVKSHGYDVIRPTATALIERSTLLPRDVGYWSFNDDGTNSLSGGASWKFAGEIGGEGFQFVDGRLIVPTAPSDNKIQLGGSVYLQNPAMTRDAFTLAFSFRSGGLPTTLGVDPRELVELVVDSPAEREANEDLIQPRKQLLTAGGYYRWLNMSLNQSCQVELELNYSPLESTRNNHYTFVVSDTAVDPTQWSDVYLTFNIPDKQVSMTIKTQDYPSGVLETFTLPDDFQWSFTDDWALQNTWSNVDEVDNNINLFNGSGSGAFEGEIDWIYAGNGVLNPSDVTQIVSKYDLVEVTPKQLDFMVSSDGYASAVTLNERDYDAWLNGGFVAGGVRNEVLRNVYRVFEDDFDFVLFVSNEEQSSLQYLGMYVEVSNTVEGINLASKRKPLFDNSAAAGSSGKLQGAIHFPLKWGIASGPSLHELAHRWGNSILDSNSLTDLSTGPNDPMEQTGTRPHWGVSSIHGQLGGFDLTTLEELGDNTYSAAPFGTYANGGNALPFSNFELYLMGLIPPSEVEDIVSFQGLSATNEEFFNKVQWKATKKIVTTIEELIAANGERIPNYLNSQKDFKALIVVLTDETMTDDELSIFSAQAKELEDTFAWGAGYRATLETGKLNEALKD